MRKFARRTLLAGAGAAVGAASTWYLTRDTAPKGDAFPPAPDAGSGTVLNDASLLSPTPVSKHIIMREDPKAQFVETVRKEIAEARDEGRPFIASAARHSMGGQSLAQNGTVVTLDQQWFEPDTDNAICKVAAGLRWGTAISKMDAIGFSPKVMQSNNDFGVASTFCVNAHGWPVSHGPFGATVRSIELITANGEQVTCSRSQNADLFNLTMGGYGLSGVITELEMEMAPNALLLPEYEVMPAEEFGTRFVEKLKSDPSIPMAYGRMDVTVGSFFEEALMITYTPADDQSDLPPASGSGFMSHVARNIFRAQLENDRVKGWRWFLETKLNPQIATGGATRNSLMNEPVITLDDRDPSRTDILHEYFVSPDRFGEFVQACRDVIPSSYQQLLNITLRFVDTDNDSLLAYATGPRIAAVMLFSQEMTVRGEEDMRRMTSALIERTLAIGGTYYLPYRLHATQDQFRRGYRRAAEFAEGKRALDPQSVFQNALWQNYIAKV